MSGSTSKKSSAKAAHARRMIEERMEQKKLKEMIQDVFSDDWEH